MTFEFFFNIYYLIFLIYLQVLAFVGDQLDFGEDVCGIVLTVRFNEDILCVWNRNSSDQQVFVPL
jgi:translation initiation factor 4E